MSVDMSIFNFLGKISNDIFRGNRFIVDFVLPSGVTPGAPSVNARSTTGAIAAMQQQMNQGGKINIKCHTATLPQRSMLTTELNQNSAAFRVPYSAQYDTVTFSFYADRNLDTRRYFEIWQSAVCNFPNNTINFLNEYTADVNIRVLDRRGKTSYRIKLIEAWPLNVGSIDLTYSGINAVATVTVTMAFKYFIPSGQSGPESRTAMEEEERENVVV